MIRVRLAMLSAMVLQAGAAGDPREALLRGVGEIAAPGVPGPVVVAGPKAFAVVAGRSHKEAKGVTIRGPVVAAAEWGKGRVVAFGHTGYLDPANRRIADTDVLLNNAIAWAAGGKVQPRMGDRPHLADLEKLDVLVLSQDDLTDEQVESIRRFVQNGGGLVTAGLGWGWLQLHPGRTLAEHPLNRVLAGSGLWFADGSLEPTGKNGFLADADRDLSGLNALTALAELADGNAIEGPERLQFSHTLTGAVRALPDDDAVLMAKVQTLLRDRGAAIVPTAKNPIKTTAGMDRVLLAYADRRGRLVAAPEVVADAAADGFPGRVPGDAETVTRVVEVNPSIPGWHGTGLYARPGVPIRVSLPEGMQPGGWVVRIGCHSDELWHLASWPRNPSIARSWPVLPGTTIVASPFGGPVYIDVPRKTGSHSLPVSIEGAVAAPRFVLGETTNQEWRESIRDLPGPWAELESDKIVLSVPSDVIRRLDDPQSLMTYWNNIADGAADLAARPRKRERAERYVADVEISAGYMHSGYPIMTHLDAAKLMVDEQAIRSGKAWGLFHELGHNHQQSEWTFDGTGEVTCNLFSLYLMETVCQLPPGKHGHEAVDKGPAVRKYMTSGRKFEQWKSDPFLALEMYRQLRAAFGWETFKRVFAEYRDLPKDQRPRGDAEERDQWMVRFSKACGKNLGPFFDTWGVPVSDQAKAKIRDMPVWMPDELKGLEAPGK